MGNVFYGDTIGYYLISRSKDLSVLDAVKNVLKIPAVYACGAAIWANIAGFEMPYSLATVMEGASWVLSAAGMVIIGIGLTKVNLKETDYKMFGITLGIRYVAAAIFLALLVFGESVVVGQLEEDERNLLLLIAAFPIAANLVVFSSFLETEEENAALLVSLSSLVSLLLVPVVCVVLFG
jgi:predicted permease